MAEMYDNNQRNSYYKKDDNLETALSDLNNLIGDVHPNLENQVPEQPIILIMGCPRSGSTLFLQWLSTLGIFSYPSNLIARFYKNPYIGIRTQQALLEYDPLNQLGFNETQTNFSSSLGKTIGALSPSEYWYFWREYFKFGELNILSSEELNNVDSTRFLSQLSAFEQLTGKPLAMKGMLLNWHIPYLHKINKKFIFIDIRRDHYFNAQSLLFARDNFFGNRNKWYSFKPEEYNSLKDKTPLEQVAGQVIYMRNAIDKGMSEIPEQNKIVLDYNDFCDAPKNVLKQIELKYMELGHQLNIDTIDTNLLNPFKNSNVNKLNNEDSTLLKKHLTNFTSKL